MFHTWEMHAQFSKKKLALDSCEGTKAHLHAHKHVYKLIVLMINWFCLEINDRYNKKRRTKKSRVYKTNAAHSSGGGDGAWRQQLIFQPIFLFFLLLLLQFPRQYLVVNFLLIAVSFFSFCFGFLFLENDKFRIPK